MNFIIFGYGCVGAELSHHLKNLYAHLGTSQHSSSSICHLHEPVAQETGSRLRQLVQRLERHWKLY